MMENSTLSGSLMNHYGLFLPTVAGQGDVEQKIKVSKNKMTKKKINFIDEILLKR